MSDVLSVVRTIRIMDVMDDAGHTSFGWDAEDDEWVLPMIREKMRQGYVFWIVRRNPLREIRLEAVSDLRDNRHVIIRDDAARNLFEQGRIGIVADGGDDASEPVRRARSGEDAVENDTVVHRGLRGG
jgi:hypothetical protein